VHGEGFFFQAFVYLAAAVISVPIAKRLGLGSVLGYLLAGVIIGPYGLEFIGEEGQDIMHFAEFGVVMMLFLIGLELQPALLWRMRAQVFGLGGLQVGFTAVLGMALGMAFGLAWQPALAVGMTLALSSTAIVLQTLAEKGLMRTDAGQSSFAVLLFQDVAVIPMLAVLPLLAMNPAGAAHHASGAHATAEAAGHGAAEGASWVAGQPGWVKTLAVLLVVTAIVLAGRYLARYLFRFIARTRLREIFTAAALLLVIGIALLMSKVGLSPALGTFVAGVVLANNEYRHELESDIEPFKGLLLGLFFVAVGASIDFQLVAAEPGAVAGLLALLIVVKFVVLFGLGRAFKMGLDQNLLFAFALAQSGEFAFVLFSFATQNAVIPEDVTALLMVVVALSMALTPLLLLLNEKLVQPRFGTKERVEREPDAIEQEHPVIIAGFGRMGATVGRLLSANRIKSTVLEYDSDHVEVLRRLGFEVYYGDASRHDLLASAGAGKARLIVLALPDHEMNLRVVESVHKHFPHLVIVARAAGRTQAYELLEAGVDHVYREAFDSALRMGVDTLRLLGLRAFHAHRSARLFRRHDEVSLRELGAMRHDQKAYLSAARQTIKDLEETLIAELDFEGEERDAGWDTDTLRADFGDKPAGK
jgi:monovalent cation:proton antiporter-2 (CPA2) family protein